MSKKEKKQHGPAANTASASQAQCPQEEKSEQEDVLQAEAAQQEKQDAPADNYYEQYLRLLADFDNYRKRTEREKAALIAYGKEDFAQKMLPMYEVLLRQQQNMRSAEKQDPQQAVKTVREGMRMILTELEKAFRAEGIQKIDTLGKPYDTQTQEVVARIPAPADKDGLVIDEVQMGFTINGKVLRPARVVVGQKQEN